MNIFESIRIALSAIIAHKLRSILTMLGIIIGVGSVILIVAIGQGGERMLQEQISGSGNVEVIDYSPSEEDRMANPNIDFQTVFTDHDIRLIEDIPEVTGVDATLYSWGHIYLGDKDVESTVSGVSRATIDMYGLEVDQGRLLSDADHLAGRQVVLINNKVKENLFEDENPLGQLIRINGQPLEVIGVLQNRELMFMSFEEIYIPRRTFERIYGSYNIWSIAIQAENPTDLEKATETTVNMMNQKYQTDAFKAESMEEISAMISTVTGITTGIFGGIAGISLLVGGIGVMNIMLVSVTERTREIGIRKSLGATRQQILFQFLIEAVTLTLIGGLIGITIGYGGAQLVAFFVGLSGSIVSIPILVGSVLFSMLIGIIFGLLPANKAARLDPIESLRFE